MRGKIALTVGGVDVTRATRGLSFSSAAMGGYDTLSVQIMLPPEALDLTPATRVTVSDARSGRVAWQGFVSSPGDQETDARRVDLTAVGNARIAEDRTERMIYIDSELSLWSPAPNASRNEAAQVASGSIPANDDVSGLVTQFPRGVAVGPGAYNGHRYDGFDGAIHNLGAYRLIAQAGITSSDWVTRVAGFGGVHDRNASTTPGVMGRDVDDFGTGAAGLSVFFRRVGAATNVANDNTWGAFSSITVKGRRLNRWGDGGVEDASWVYVTGQMVIEDLIGRGLLPGVDPAAAEIGINPYQITQLTYPDPTRPRQVLDDIAAFDSNWLWQIGAHNGVGYTLRWQPWPTTPRYTLDDRDSYVRQGQELGWANRVKVLWSDAQGRQRVAEASLEVPELDGAGRVVYADPISLPDGLGSAENAAQIGTETLRDLYNQPASGTALVGRRIFDHQCGGWVEPWEIEPGSLVQIARTGDVIRLTAVEWDDDNYTARLTLGNPGRTAEERMAAVAGRR